MQTKTIPDLMSQLQENTEADWLFAMYKMGRLSKSNLHRQLKRIDRRTNIQILTNPMKEAAKNER